MSGGAAAGAYSIEQHTHLFAAWAASRAASVIGCRFSVERGRTVLEAVGFVADFSTPEQLPDPVNVDAQHKQWRNCACDFAANNGLTLTHGVAAKLINVYLKSRFVCGGQHSHKNVAAMHPPIDKLLLEKLAKNNFGQASKEWKRFSANGWSKLTSDCYEDLIDLIRTNIGDKPLWMIEEYWKGNQ
jgi:hypothetical protein